MLNRLIPVLSKRQSDEFPVDAKSCVQIAEKSTQQLPQFYDENIKFEISRVLGRAANTTWQNPEIEHDARQAALGLVLSLNNGMARQVGLHLEQLELACGRNSAEATVKALKRTNIKAKPFAICEEADTSFQINGHGYEWQIDSLDISNELIPAVYLARINFIRSYGIEPDAVFVGVPYSVEKPSLPAIIGKELETFSNQIRSLSRGAKESVSQALQKVGELRKLPDPVLLIGFGSKPCVLVEISRWV